VWLVDCGEGTQHQLVRRPDLVKTSKLDIIFITHLHGDHCFGLPGLLASMSLSGQVSALKVIGPLGISQMIDTNLKLSQSYLTYALEVVELEPERVHDLGTFNQIRVRAFPLKHKDIACFGFFFEEENKPPVLNGKKAAQLGAKGAQLGQLKVGKDVTLPNGTVIRAEDVLEPGAAGKKVLILGDTSDSNSALEAIQGCDLIVHETTYDCDMYEKAIDGGHSTTIMAGEYARVAKAKKLIITHFSKRYVEGSGDKTVDDLKKEAQQQCPDTVVEAAEEFNVYSF